VKKQRTTPASTPTESEVGHLNQTLSRAARTTAKTLNQWRTPIVSILAVALLAVLAYTAYDALRSQKEYALSATVYELFRSPAAAEEGYQPDEKKVAELLAEVQGKPAEKYVYKTVVDYYLKTSTELSRKQSETSALPASSPGETSPGNTAAMAILKAAEERVLTLSETAAKQFPDDSDVQTWARNAKKKVAGQRDKDWFPAGWHFTPPLPQPVAGEPVSRKVPALEE